MRMALVSFFFLINITELSSTFPLFPSHLTSSYFSLPLSFSLSFLWISSVLWHHFYVSQSLINLSEVLYRPIWNRTWRKLAHWLVSLLTCKDHLHILWSGSDFLSWGSDSYQLFLVELTYSKIWVYTNLRMSCMAKILFHFHILTCVSWKKGSTFCGLPLLHVLLVIYIRAKCHPLINAILFDYYTSQVCQ